jgi:hypothetical protein
MMCKLSCAAMLAAATLGLLSGCHSYHIDTTIENRTGAAVKLLEVDYPSASFGIDAIAPGADFNYRFQIRGNGQLKVQYTEPNGQIAKLTGPTLDEGQEGKLDIVLLPQAKVEFRPDLSPGH